MRIKILACIAKFMGIQFHVGGFPFGANVVPEAGSPGEIRVISSTDP